MRFAFCLFKYFPYGGLERDFLRIALECQKRGHAIDVYTMKWTGAVPAGFNIHKIAAEGFTNHARCANFVKQVLPQIAQGYDVVIGFNRMPGLNAYFAADVCYAASVKQKHGWWYRLTSRYRTYIQFEQAVFAKDAATQILLLVEPEKKYFQHFYETPESRFHLVPAGIERSHVNLSQDTNFLRTQMKIPDDDFLLLMVGSDFKRKGVDRALRALASLPDSMRKKSHLAIIGQGKMKPYLQLARSLQIINQISFLGTRDDVRVWMRNADVLIHPAYQETAGMVLIEALVSGLPVLVTGNCGYAFHIQRAQAGIVVPMPFSQKALDQSLLNMLTSDKKQTWRQNALRYAENTDFYSLPQKAADLFEAIGKPHVV